MKNIFDKTTTKKYEVEGFILNTKNISKFCDVFFQKKVEDTLLQKKNFKIPYIILNGEKIEKFSKEATINFFKENGFIELHYLFGGNSTEVLFVETTFLAHINDVFIEDPFLESLNLEAGYEQHFKTLPINLSENCDMPKEKNFCQYYEFENGKYYKTKENINFLEINDENIEKIIKTIEYLSIKRYFIKLKRENSNGIKRHKVLKYSQADLNTREILKEFFKNKTSNQILKNVYPNFDEWFDKVLKEIEEDNTKREILFFGNINSNGFQIEGIAILKNTEEEKKICYLYISFSEDVDNVFEEIYNYLGTETPLITLEKEIFEDKYKNYLVTSKKERKLKFKLTSIVPNKYVKGKTELIFNEVGEN